MNISIPELALVVLIGPSGSGKSSFGRKHFKPTDEYRGKALMVYGHTPIPEPEWLNHTVNIDTGCVFGGQLTALRYPERELLSVPARQVYYESPKPLVPAAPGTSGLTTQQREDDLLDIEDVLGKRLIDTRLQPKITIREENSLAAL